MKLLHAKDLKLASFHDASATPEYVILSHTWGEDEITFKDLQQAPLAHLSQRQASQKIARTCAKALEWGLEWVWIDTLCIDQSSSAELSEAINSMYEWYRLSAVCFALLSDVATTEKTLALDHHFQSFKAARWFTRGWCLQELLAPRNMHFFNRDWQYIGSKYSLRSSIAEITQIDEYGMFIPDLSVLSVAHRMSWAADRETTRPEDVAYCLLGIFNISMPLLYGEGQARAFYRLQEEILQRTEDHSIFAWNGQTLDFKNDVVGFLAPHPSAFTYRQVRICKLPFRTESISIGGRGIRAELPLIRTEREPNEHFAIIGCCRARDWENFYAIPIGLLEATGDVYRRRAARLFSFTREEIQAAVPSTIFLLRQSMPTHLEAKDTVQVWLSRLEMRNCVYSIRNAFPQSRWNKSRRVFAFSKTDLESDPDVQIVFENDKSCGFSLSVHLDSKSGRPLLNLVLLERPISHYGSDDEMLESSALELYQNPTASTAQLCLGTHNVSAWVGTNTVFEQKLFEVRVEIE